MIPVCPKLKHKQGNLFYLNAQIFFLKIDKIFEWRCKPDVSCCIVKQEAQMDMRGDCCICIFLKFTTTLAGL